MSNEITRSPEIIAAEINYIKSQTSGILSAAYSYARNSCIEIGKRLIEVKEMIPFGKWGEWLKSNFEYSESTAGNLMRIYKEYGNEQIDLITGKSPAETFEGLTQSQLTELFALPKSIRGEFVEQHREELVDGDMSIRDMRELIKQQKETIEKQEKAKEEENEKLQSTINDLREEIENIKSVESVVTAIEKVYEPSKEQIKEIKREAIEKTEKKHQLDIEKLTEEIKNKDTEKEEALKAAKDEYLREIRRLTSQSNPRTAKVLYYMETIGRALSDINNEIKKINEETPGEGDKIFMRCETNLLGMLNKFGWSI